MGSGNARATTERGLGWVLAIRFASHALPPLVAATVWNVPERKPTIEAALKVVESGDEIVLAPGTYREHHLDPRGREVTLRSVETDSPEPTVIDGDGYGPILIFRSGEGPTMRVVGLTLRGARPSPLGPGGGVWCQNASPQFEGCRIIDNLAEHGGGGIRIRNGAPRILDTVIGDNRVTGIVSGGGGVYCRNAAPTFLRCEIAENRALDGDGGGLECHESSPTLISCHIRSNQCPRGAGGGLASHWNSSPRLRGCRIAKNRATHGGGVVTSGTGALTLQGTALVDNTSEGDGGGLMAYEGRIQLTNCLVARNQAEGRGGGAHIGRDATVLADFVTWTQNRARSGGPAEGAGHLVLKNSIVWDNEPPPLRPRAQRWSADWCNLEDDAAGQGNRAQPPRFRSFRSFDYVLRGNSPCIDAADPSLEDGLPWSDFHAAYETMNRPRADMGAYGGPAGRLWQP